MAKLGGRHPRRLRILEEGTITPRVVEKAATAHGDAVRATTAVAAAAVSADAVFFRLKIMAVR